MIFICATLLCLWRSALALIGVWDYWRLNTLIPVQVENWEVEQLGSSEYTIIATYSYDFSGKRYQSKIKFNKPYYLNRYAAQDDIKKFSQRSWTGWINAKNPQISSLERNFPYLKIFYAFVTLGVVLYFFYIYAYNKKSELLN